MGPTEERKVSWTDLVFAEDPHAANLPVLAAAALVPYNGTVELTTELSTCARTYMQCVGILGSGAALGLCMTNNVLLHTFRILRGYPLPLAPVHDESLNLAFQTAGQAEANRRVCHVSKPTNALQSITLGCQQLRRKL